jgi:release factor glutamine methyltransferase
MPALTIAQCLGFAPQLASVSDSPRLDVELLLAHLLHQNRTYLFTWPEKVLTLAQAETFNALFSRRLSGEPIAHIIGQREFWSLPLAVNNTTLIPRPDTELLVESVLKLFAQDSSQQLRYCLDLGTGTGAIVLAIASEKQSWKLLGVDKSQDAVILAEKNRTHLQFNHVRIQQSDWFAQIPAQQFDVIVSNPPYIDPQDPHLQQGDVRFEPRSALVAEHNGLADIEQIIAQAWNYLTDTGWLLLEHGYDQAGVVRDLLRERGFVQVKTHRDYGGNERVTLGQKLGSTHDE